MKNVGSSLSLTTSLETKARSVCSLSLIVSLSLFGRERLVRLIQTAVRGLQRKRETGSQSKLENRMKNQAAEMKTKSRAARRRIPTGRPDPTPWDFSVRDFFPEATVWVRELISGWIGDQIGG